MIRVKPGCEFRIFRSEIYGLWSGLEIIFAEYDAELTITCGTEDHLSDDPHFHGFAMDFRSKDVPARRRYALLDHLKEHLGERYTVLLEHPGDEDEHFHIQIRKDLWKALVA